MKVNTAFIFILFSALLISCSPYQKALKNPDLNKKLEMAQHYYNKKDYYRASILFEQLQDNFNGTAMAEKVMYYSAYCNYGLQNNLLAGYQFKSYYENFPTGQWAEESLYMFAYCQFLESQEYYLDQTDTYKALESIRIFISVYPESKYVSECNILMDKLRAKLAFKAYKSAKLYYNTEEYKSAIVALQNLVKDYPELPQREEVSYLIVRSHFLLAENSIEQKKEERYKSAIESFNSYLEQYPESKYINDLKKLHYKSDIALKKILAKKEESQ